MVPNIDLNRHLPLIWPRDNMQAVALNHLIADIGRDTFLKKQDVEWELNAQINRTEERYEIIGICCAVVVAVAALILIWSLAFPAFLAIPKIVIPCPNGLDHIHRIAAPGYEMLELGLFLILDMGSLLGVPLLGFLTFGIAMGICAYKVNCIVTLRDEFRPNPQIDQANKGRVDERHIYTLLEGADEETTNNLVQKMDFQQLIASEKVLGFKKIKKLLLTNPDNIAKLQVLKVIASADSDALRANLMQLHLTLNLKVIEQNHPALKLKFFEIIRERNDLNLLVHAAKTWTELTAPTPIQTPKYRVRLENSQGKEFLVDHTFFNDIQVYSNFFMEFNESQSQLALAPKVEAEKKHKLEKDGKLEADKKHAKSEFQIEDETIFFGGLSKEFWEALQLLLPKALDPAVNKDRLMDLLIGSHQYLDRLIDNLQLIFSDRELIDYLNKPEEMSLDAFNAIKKKDLLEIRREDFANLKRGSSKNVIIVEYLEMRLSIKRRALYKDIAKDFIKPPELTDDEFNAIRNKDLQKLTYEDILALQKHQINVQILDDLEKREILRSQPPIAPLMHEPEHPTSVYSILQIKKDFIQDQTKNVNNLQHIYPPSAVKDLIKLLKKPNEISQQEFDALKNKELDNFTLEDLNLLKTQMGNEEIVTLIERTAGARLQKLENGMQDGQIRELQNPMNLAEAILFGHGVRIENVQNAMDLAEARQLHGNEILIELKE